MRDGVILGGVDKEYGSEVLSVSSVITLTHEETISSSDSSLSDEYF